MLRTEQCSSHQLIFLAYVINQCTHAYIKKTGLYSPLHMEQNFAPTKNIWNLMLLLVTRIIDLRIVLEVFITHF